MILGVAGAGAFGTAMAIALADGGQQVRLWGRDPDQINRLRTTRENARYLPGIPLPATVEPVSQIAALADASCVLLVVPAQTTALFWEAHGTALKGCQVLLCAKGVEKGTFRLQSEICPDAVGVLTGPGFAAEIARGLPTALTLALRTADPGLQEALSRPRLRLYMTNDLVGAQLGGALKNVVAIAAGIAIGASLGESARAAIMTRGFAEMRRLALAMGARESTLAGLSGLGDLSLTCASDKSRNFAHGLALGRGVNPDKSTVEGVATAQAALGLAARHGVEMPVAQAVASVLDGSARVDQAIGQLLARPLRAE